MSKIKYDKTMIVGLCASQTNARPSSTGGGICVINANIDRIVIGIDESTIFRRTLVHVVDIAVCWVGSLSFDVLANGKHQAFSMSYREEVEHVEERGG